MLLPVLGLTWVCGILVHLSIIWAYVFIVLNSLQVSPEPPSSSPHSQAGTCCFSCCSAIHLHYQLGNFVRLEVQPKFPKLLCYFIWRNLSSCSQDMKDMPCATHPSDVPSASASGVSYWCYIFLAQILFLTLGNFIFLPTLLVSSKEENFNQCLSD